MSEQTTLNTRTSSGKSTRKISWDVVRTACVTLVMLYHGTHLSVQLHPELAPRTFEFPFQVGASMLLVISAYFACVTIGRGAVSRYWWNRVARLFPPFVGAVLVIYFVMRLVPIEGWFFPGPQHLVENLLMLWHWDDDVFFLDGSHWTVPLQLMGFTAAAVLYRARLGHGRAVVGLLWVLVFLPIAQWPLRVSGPPEVYRVLVDGLGAHRWHLFVAGIAIWLWSQRRIGNRHFTALLASCMFAQALHNHAVMPDGSLEADWGSTIAVCIGLVVIAATANGPDWNRFVPDWLGRRFTWFAGISYGVFLMHQTLGYVVSRKLQDAGFGPTTQTLAMLITGVLLGWALTHVVERPIHRTLMRGYDRWAQRRGRAPVLP
ncbi:acyltransferase family protein [Salinifilum aidingensis]